MPMRLAMDEPPCPTRSVGRIRPAGINNLGTNLGLAESGSSNGNAPVVDGFPRLESSALRGVRQAAPGPYVKEIRRPGAT